MSDSSPDADWARLKQKAHTDAAKMLVELTELYLSTSPNLKQLLDYDELLHTIIKHVISNEDTAKESKGIINDVLVAH